jgi:hypothetical protein
MSKINLKLDLLGEHLNSSAFLVSKGGAEKEAHSKIVNSLIILSELKTLFATQNNQVADANFEESEIVKVKRRLKLWAKRPNQINSKILTAHLKLKRSGLTKITESDLENELPNEKSFRSNFIQMKTITKNNHGKIFEQNGKNISLWEPVISAINEYEAIVFEIN